VIHRTVFIRLIGAASLCLPVLCQAQAPQGYTITTFAGNGTAGFLGDAAAATSAELSFPYGVAMDTTGNLYIADQFNHRIRKVAVGGTITTVAGNGTAGFAGDKAAATSAELNYPSGVAVDSSGNLYIADTSNHVIRKVTGTTITTVAGNNASGSAGDAGPATSANLNSPTGVVVDAKGIIYIVDTGNNQIRKVATDGTITLVATSAQLPLSHPQGAAVDAAGNLYIADTDNHRIRKMTVAGAITVVAGNGNGGYSGDGGPATSAELYYPSDVAVDAAGNLYISDTVNSRIRRVSAADGTITTVAGASCSPIHPGSICPGYSGDGGPATSAQLNLPRGIALNASSGNLYVADNENSAIRLLTPILPSINSAIAPGAWIEIYGSNLAAGSRAWTGADFNGVNAPTSLDGTTVTIGGQAAFIAYVSPGQVNVQVPSNVATGQQQITVTTPSGTRASSTVTVNSTAVGMWAPSWSKIGGKQYVAALFPDGSYVLPPGAISGVASRRAKPGDIIVIYGGGFGPVTPDIPAGQLVQNDNTLALPFQILFGQTPATLQYWGLAPNLTGVYQFNVVVPNVAASDAVPLTFTLGGVSGTQTLYTAVGN
jgi:uncharacterized protein (TIGR03437 family)